MCSLSSKFSQALLLENCLLLEQIMSVDNIHVSEVILMLNAGYFFNLGVFIYVNQAFGFVTIVYF